ncbi:unnamed protein product [Protopolystoma xenopodis]|uniref:Uncharacterized protein n=1 Tax=Protopolystoma xenopodis TaxID=117903 RepID=A0A448XLT7_9PLAT|nr:unnamed protein product [Protopolystoma xenopodis]
MPALLGQGGTTNSGGPARSSHNFSHHPGNQHADTATVHSSTSSNSVGNSGNLQAGQTQPLLPQPAGQMAPGSGFAVFPVSVWSQERVLRKFTVDGYQNQLMFWPHH